MHPPSSPAPAARTRLLVIDDDRKLCRRLGLAARDKAMNEFDENIVISKTLRVYGELLDSMRQAVGVGKRSERRV